MNIIERVERLERCTLALIEVLTLEARGYGNPQSVEGGLRIVREELERIEGDDAN